MQSFAKIIDIYGSLCAYTQMLKRLYYYLVIIGEIAEPMTRLFRMAIIPKFTLQKCSLEQQIEVIISIHSHYRVICCPTSASHLLRVLAFCYIDKTFSHKEYDYEYRPKNHSREHATIKSQIKGCMSLNIFRESLQRQFLPLSRLSLLLLARVKNLY